jgi:NhaP-type Na+/H+ or K+/H+ antiporter
MLRVYSPTFRREYRREMLLVFTIQARDTIQSRSVVSFLRFALHIAWDWITTVVAETEGENMQKLVMLGIAVFVLLFVDWLTFHDWRELHTVRDYLTLFASLLVFIYVGMQLLGREHANGTGVDTR